MRVCPVCETSNFDGNLECKKCKTALATKEPQALFNPPEISGISAPYFCTSCHSFCNSKTAHNGTVWNEALILGLAVLVGLFNFLIGAGIFLFFLIYGVWRLTTKKQVCEYCQHSTVIPSNSPLVAKLKQ